MDRKLKPIKNCECWTLRKRGNTRILSNGRKIQEVTWNSQKEDIELGNSVGYSRKMISECQEMSLEAFEKRHGNIKLNEPIRKNIDLVSIEYRDNTHIQEKIKKGFGDLFDNFG